MKSGEFGRRLSLVIVAVTLVAATVDIAEAAKRVALLIGNQEYRSTTPLRNPANDVELMRKTFLDAGFDDVEVAIDLDLVTMRKTLRAFEDKADGAEIAVLYYSGHGMEMNGTNYLIPTDAVLRSDKDVEDEALPLDRAERSLNGATKLKLVILDACRNNPFIDAMATSSGTRAIQRGLAKVEPEGADTLVAYASRAGTVALDGAGVNSPFAEALSKYLAQPGVDVRIAFGQVRDEVVKVTQRKQEPFVYGSLGGAQIFLSIKELNITINKTETKPEKKEETAPNGISSAAADWQNIKDLADKELLEAFIAKHGADPVYKMLAQKKLKLLAEAEAKAEVSADQIAWEALKGSTDIAALKRFIERYPESKFRPEAEVAIGMMAPVQNPTISDAAKASPAARDCYLLAAEPQSLPGFPGVYMARIDAKRALTACAQAVNEYPEDGMLVNLLGRAHEADRNFTEARRNYEKAAKLGDLYAQTNLGWFAVYGLDGPIDAAKGRDLFEKAAKSGNHAAEAALGYLYRNGQGVDQSDAEAIKWYEKAARQGNAVALGNLGWFYREGVGVEQDYVKSLDYYRRGAAAGDNASIAAMGYAAQNGLGMAKNFAEALRWYEKGANAGDDYSMASLGFLYDTGAGVKQDYVEARYWYEKAANSGNAYAMGNLSRLYDQGLGTPIDAAEAVRWAIAAVERGDKTKIDELKTMPANFSAAFRKEFQKVLKERGFYSGLVNGDFGDEINEAIDALAAGEQPDQRQQDDQDEDSKPDEGSTGNDMHGNQDAGEETVTSIADAITFQPNKRSETPRARECYVLAAEPGYDPTLEGVSFVKLQADRVIDVCNQAIAEEPGDSMLHDMLGRAYQAKQDVATARGHYNKAVELGNAYAYVNLAWLKINGNGEARDEAKGVAMLEKAARAGNAYAQASLATVYRNGNGAVDADEEKAIEWFTKAADQEYAEAQAALGWSYREGVGVERDYEKSFVYYMKAAEAGDVGSMGAVGYALQNGLGIAVDFEEARRWYEKGEEANDGYSISALAWLYREGKGVEQDYEKALELYQRAYELGDVNGTSGLGYMKQFGMGTPVDLAEAKRLYETAAGLNDAYANAALGWMYREGSGVPRDYRKSLDYYRRGAELGDLNAMGSLGYAIQNGLGTDVDYAEAKTWYEKGAERNDAYSMASLAWLYENGMGVTQDLAIAKGWYRKAADAGNTYAMGNLAYMYDQGQAGDVDLDEAQRLAFASMEGGEQQFIDEMKAGATRFSPDFRKKIQSELRRRGLYKGLVDGVFGASTATAIDRLVNG
ncbi:caspase family protein [Rhizobium alvei]|uniref:Caspase family protein n=1 Tax=Rhizobium alvei TaxID=1132659 RepID=A0ABT8YSL4_9HYPH|nr:caspase family protein [Rhizobium alvei]MDO6966763.1 caspase family protein [Rhizobium alvei]